jgi:CRISPR/Cas system-associated exonuclease Cas4 (RecB family)
MLQRIEQQRMENQRLIQKRKVWHQGLRKSVQEIKRFSKTLSDRTDPDPSESLKNVKVTVHPSLSHVFSSMMNILHPQTLFRQNQVLQTPNNTLIYNLLPNIS